MEKITVIRDERGGQRRGSGAVAGKPWRRFPIQQDHRPGPGSSASRAPVVRLADRYAVPFTLFAFLLGGAAWWRAAIRTGSLRSWWWRHPVRC